MTTSRPSCERGNATRSLSRVSSAAATGDLINKLERVSRGEIDRLALFMPPGSAKSTYATILYPKCYVIS